MGKMNKAEVIIQLNEAKSKIQSLNIQLEEKEKEYCQLEEMCVDLEDKSKKYEHEIERLNKEIEDLKDDDDFKSYADVKYMNGDDVWFDMITGLIPFIAKRCGIKNDSNFLTDWLDIKPSVFQSRILSKKLELSKDGIFNKRYMAQYLCLELYAMAYMSENFQKYWRKLSPKKL